MRKLRGFLLITIFSFLLFFLGTEAHAQFTINFNNVDIRTFIRLVSEFTGENYVLDPNIRGSITVYSQKPVESQKLPQVFNAILNLYGASVIQRDGLSFIVPSAEAKTRSHEVNLGDIPREKNDTFLTQIITLKFASVESLSQLLAPYITKSGQISIDSRSNTLFISDFGASIAKIQEILAIIDQPSPPGKESLRIYKLENSNAEDIAKVLNEVLSKQKPRVTAVRPGQIQSSQPLQPTVVAVKATNSLIIYAETEEYESIEKLVKEMDIMTGQVLIEALIVEATWEAEKSIGIEWATTQKFKDGKYTGAAGTSFGAIGGYAASGVLPDGLSFGFYKNSLTYPLSVGALLNLYAQDSRFNILSTPQIMTADNQEATISISDNIPYLKETRFIAGTGTSSSDTIKSYDYKDVGISLTITPQISQNKYVRLKIKQEVTKLLEGGTPEAPSTAKRSAETTLIIPNNQTIVLGGLIRDDAEKTVKRVPGLGDIWPFKYFFRHESKSSTKTNLMIFITPRIVTSFEEAEALSVQKQEEMKASENNGK